MNTLEQQALKEAESLLMLVKKHRPIIDECPRCDGMGCSGPCSPRYWEAPLLEGFSALIQERSKPSLIVAFSEEDVDRISNNLRRKLKRGNQFTEAFTIGARMGLRYANTRAVSIDRVMEKVASWDACRTTDPYPEGNDSLRAMWNDLSERLKGLTEQPK